MSKEDNSKCLVLSNSDESDCETVRSHSLDTHGQESGKQQVKKRNKALQVRFKDICDAQLEQRGRRSRSISSKVTHRKYMTMPARRSIPNVTKSTGVQTSPDLTKRYKTFPFERKKGHTFKHTALVEDYRGQNNGFLSDIKAGVEDDGSIGQSSVHKGKIVGQTKALLHHTDDSKDLLPGANCLDGSSCPDSSLLSKGPESCPNKPPAKAEQEHQGCGTRTKHKGLPKDETGASTSTKRHLANSEEILRDTGSKGAGPPWNSLTQMESLGSPSARCKRKKATQLNGQQSYTLPHSAKCSAQQAKGLSRARHASASSKIQQTSSEDKGFPAGVPRLGASQPILTGDGDIKAQLQAMENLISSSQETIKVLLGVIQELEKGEAQRGGLTYRTGQDTANCDTCRNSACIIYSVELDFKLQEDQLHPLMKRLCPLDSPQCPALPYSNEVFTSTPKRKAKTETKRHARWKRWFL